MRYVIEGECERLFTGFEGLRGQKRPFYRGSKPVSYARLDVASKIADRIGGIIHQVDETTESGRCLLKHGDMAR